MRSPKVIMITGAAGYVGAMLCHQFSRSPDLQKIIAVDIKTMPPLLKENKKIVWLTANLTENVWKVPALINKPEVVIHSATSANELAISRAVFEFYFKSGFAKKLIYLSDAAAYGAFAENSSERQFVETDELREDEFPVGRKKKMVEAELRSQQEASGGGQSLDDARDKQVVVLRLPAITGPRGRGLEVRGSLPFFPVGSDKWCRQYVHEDDLTDAIAMFTFSNSKTSSSYEVYNLSPGDVVPAREIARQLAKPLIKIPPVFMRPACYLAWKLSSGEISTPAGAWRFLSFPIVVDGSLITKKYGFEYYFNSHDALTKDEGRYTEQVE